MQFWSSWNFSDAPIQAYADDYAFLIQGLLDLYEACFDEKLIKMAFDLQKQMDYQFWDAENNNGYYQTVDDPHIVFRIINGRFASTSFFPCTLVLINAENDNNDF